MTSRFLWTTAGGLVLVACGDDAHERVDASAHDASAHDASSMDAAPQPALDASTLDTGIGNTTPLNLTDASCASGLDCVSGYCDLAPHADAGLCVAANPCAHQNERCREDIDCCTPAQSSDSFLVCIGNYCGETL